MHAFDFFRPGSLEEAVEALANYGDESRVIAGGTALMLALRQRLLQPQCLISVEGLEAMRGIDWDLRRGLRIGALTLHNEVAASKLVKAHYPMLAELAKHMANPQVRNRGTLGGNLCYADPATDPPTALLALDARVVLHSVRGSRELPVSEFLVDYYTTAIEPDELLVEVLIPPPGSFAAGGYTRFLKTAAEHRPLATIAVSADRNGRICQAIRIAVGATTPVPMRLSNAEQHLSGQEMNASLIGEAAAIIAVDIDALDDSRGEEWYRRRMTEVIARRTLARVFDIEIEAEK
ncbi:FAD binding domain-containing protein [Pusillimonas noertemannii]|uniref:Carbon-monoxide dehydrogenase medium subunit n=1 Tax=Pusillimonas noertemannii TaxID=305977 RepID=A0A2U1CPL3_9BURK|nr:xanthine dehydrogenase family protein subunit M [Pusillimonas noertemannii]NYT67151.1 xanthine dehydrogenase family protein subunit M [Pusillimonas noertemannii]PVY67826.1 carbon-monoxide dehydrogenase medium subunit [Pusillimonas noertemannii]TFL12648.1 xanthine dehydrogenase family protein subunit M [Pusillimonas noertemannii]